VFGVSTPIVAETTIVLVPDPALAVGVWAPYALLVPYWNT
jgi:hypothetical protein